jgi:EpsI family protein
MLVIGRAGGVAAVQAISLLVSITGIVVLLLGSQFLRTVWFPIAYLLFMTPVWGSLTERLHLPFQLFSANVAVAVLQFLGVPAYREAVYIELPRVTLEVAKVCSGVNYLIAVIAIGVPLAYLYLKGWRRRVALVSFAVIVSILSNSFRVALIGLLSYYGFDGPLHGPFHVLQALSVSAVGYLAIFAGLWCLSQRPSAGLVERETIRQFVPAPAAATNGARVGAAAFCLASLLLLAGGYVHFVRPTAVPLERSFGTFPLRIGGWHGVGSSPDQLAYRASGADAELARVYENGAGNTIGLYVAYYSYQRQAKELVSYRTDVLHQDAARVTLRLADALDVEVNQVVKQDGGRRRLVLFWYDVNGRVVASPYVAKAYTTWDALTRNRTNGALVVVTADLGQDGDPADALARIEGFPQAIGPLLDKYLPRS